MALLLLCTSTISIEFRSCPRCHLHDISFQPFLIGLISSSARAIASVITEWILKEHRAIHLPQQTLWINLYVDWLGSNVIVSWAVVISIIRLPILDKRKLSRSLTYTNWNMYSFSLLGSEVIRGLSTPYVLKQTDSLTGSFIYCSSIVVAALVLSIVLDQSIPYPLKHCRTR